jgi:hypothetical protein
MPSTIREPSSPSNVENSQQGIVDTKGALRQSRSTRLGDTPNDFAKNTRRFSLFHGAKPAQSGLASVEFIGILTGSVGAHNLKVVGSNPTPATKLQY